MFTWTPNVWQRVALGLCALIFAGNMLKSLNSYYDKTDVVDIACFAAFSCAALGGVGRRMKK